MTERALQMHAMDMEETMAVLRSGERKELIRLFVPCGTFWFSCCITCDAWTAGNMWRSGRGRTLGRWEASVDQSLYAVSGPRGAQALLEGNLRGLPHLLGPGVRQRRVCGSAGACSVARWSRSVPLVWMTSSTPRATNTTGQSGRPISDSGACVILPAGTDAVYGC